MKTQNFKYLYCMPQAKFSMQKKYVSTNNEGVRSIPALMLFHTWDSQALHLTPVLVYESKDDTLTSRSPDVARLLQQVAEKLHHFSLLPNLQSDYTNRHPWGKIKVEI